MTPYNELKEAVKVTKKYWEDNKRQDINVGWITADFKQALQTLLALAENYLKLYEQGGVKEITIDPNNGYYDGYNKGIQEYCLWMAGKLMELEKICAEFIPHSASYCINDLATAIRQEVMGGE